MKQSPEAVKSCPKFFLTKSWMIVIVVFLCFLHMYIAMLVFGNFKRTSWNLHKVYILSVYGDKSSERIIREYTKPRRAYLCKNGVGRLGNQLFSYAGLLGIARTKNMTPVLHDTYGEIFTYFPHSSVLRSVERCRKPISKNEQHCAFNTRDLEFPNNVNITLHGYFQSWWYFRDIQSEIRRHFAIESSVREKAREAIERKTSSFRNVSNLLHITVHVRRSDVIEKKRIAKYGFTTPGVNYYKKAMDYFRRQFKHVVFIVCSDGMKWAKTNLFAPDVVFIENNTAILDFAVLSMGNHTIMSVGTYGWWASFLANGLTIAYKYPARENSRYRKHFSSDMKDFFLPHWILLDDL